MTENKHINLRSSTIEKGLELAKEFLGKLIYPAIEEIGLLAADNIRFLRFKNQVKILLRARNYVESNNLKINEIPIKILVPLLEHGSLEESEELQDKWASMLVNMATSSENFQNQVFPYILSQISLEEFEQLEKLKEDETAYRLKYDRWREIWGQSTAEGKKLKKEVETIQQEGHWLQLEEYECANLSRLGLVRQLPSKIHIKEFTTGGFGFQYEEKSHELEAQYDHDDYGFRITELGRKFLEVCSLNKKVSSDNQSNPKS